MELFSCRVAAAAAPDMQVCKWTLPGTDMIKILAEGSRKPQRFYYKSANGMALTLHPAHRWDEEEVVTSAGLVAKERRHHINSFPITSNL
jgi:hypothetical protein